MRKPHAPSMQQPVAIALVPAAENGSATGQVALFMGLMALGATAFMYAGLHQLTALFW